MESPRDFYPERSPYLVPLRLVVSESVPAGLGRTDLIFLEKGAIIDIELKKPQVKALHESEKSGNIEASDNKDS